MSTFKNDVTIDEPRDNNAIEGIAADGRGVVGTSETNYGIRAHSIKSAGIRGSSDEGRGVEGWATNSEGVVGISTNGNAVWGQTDGAGVGVLGTSKSGVGVHGKGGRLAGFFDGNVEVTGRLKIPGLPQNMDDLAAFIRDQQVINTKNGQDIVLLTRQINDLKARVDKAGIPQ